MNRQQRRDKIRLYKDLQAEGERRGFTGKEINEEAHIVMDEREKRMPTIKQCYKDMIGKRWLPNWFNDLVMPELKRNRKGKNE